MERYETSQDEEHLAGAHRVLGLLSQRRAVAAGIAQRRTQATIAQDLGISQAEVSRMLQVLREHPEFLEETPGTVIARYTLGQIDRAELVRTLGGWQFTFGEFEPDAFWPEYAGGSWDQVESAWLHGEIDRDTMAQITAQVNPPDDVSLAAHLGR